MISVVQVSTPFSPDNWLADVLGVRARVRHQGLYEGRVTGLVNSFQAYDAYVRPVNPSEVSLAMFIEILDSFAVPRDSERSDADDRYSSRTLERDVVICCSLG